jgi:hypothetical protein
MSPKLGELPRLNPGAGNGGERFMFAPLVLPQMNLISKPTRIRDALLTIRLRVSLRARHTLCDVDPAETKLLFHVPQLLGCSVGRRSECLHQRFGFLFIWLTLQLA